MEDFGAGKEKRIPAKKARKKLKSYDTERVTKIISLNSYGVTRTARKKK